MNKNYLNNTKESKHIIILFLLFVSMFFLVSCKKKNPDDTISSPEKITKSAFMLNTIVTINLYNTNDTAVLDEALALCNEYEKIFSRTMKNSELYQLNHRTLPQTEDGGFLVSDDMARLIRNGLYYSTLSNGYFDVTIAPLSELWDFSGTNPKVPSDDSIKNVLINVDYNNVSIKNNTVYFTNPDTLIDLGGIAKGYIADRIKDFLIKNGVDSATINLGGNVLCVGEKQKNTPFSIGIQKPYADRNETIAVIGVSNKTVVSSGIYERFFVEDEVSYHHIINPATGYPFENDLVSVSIICDKSVDGDGLSTTCFSLGLEKGMELINSLKDTYAVFITKDYEILYSDGFEDHITIISD